jgi:uncharacterized protein (TIGR00299 family) protein
MRIAYLDCFSGISGDMFLGALVDAGASPDLLRKTVRALNVGAELEITRVLRNGIAATKVDVVVNGEKDLPREEFWAKQHSHAHGHEHSHEHRHADGTVHSHPHAHEEDHEHTAHSHAHRGLKEIREIIGKADISETAKTTALRIFQALGEAEARIHNTDIEKIHFHEVGAVDAIVDIVCAAVGADALGVDEWHCSPLNVGGGVVHCAHGTLPVPAPATLELLRDAPVYSSEVQKELVTPTGAAIVRTLATKFGSLPMLKVESCGYGAGARDLPGQANVLRITVGETDTVNSRGTGDLVTVLEASLDDATPQVFGYALERVLEQGALDAFATPVQMKKNRPGALLTVLARPEDARRLADIIFAESTTIGLRMHDEQRLVLEREWVPVETEWGKVRIKIARWHGSECNAAPEFEDCRRIASNRDVPLKQVMQEAMRAYLEAKQESKSGTHK